MKKILISIGLVLLGLVGFGMTLPTEMNLEKEIVINKPKDLVFAELKTFKNHSYWSPWAKKDPNMKQEFKGTDGTVGFISSWDGNKDVGTGEEEIKNIVEGERIDVELRFKKPWEDTSKAYFVTIPAGDNMTTVKWGFNGNSPFPFNLICYLTNMKDQLGNEFYLGLVGLKEYIEKK